MQHLAENNGIMDTTIFRKFYITGTQQKELQNDNKVRYIFIQISDGLLNVLNWSDRIFPGAKNLYYN